MTGTDAEFGRSRIDGSESGRLGRLGRFAVRYRWPMIAAWIALTLFGGFAAGKVSSRWYQSVSVPGKPAYEASQRTLKAFGAGVTRSERRRLPHERRRDEEQGDRAGDAARRRHDARRAHDLVLLDRQLDVRLARHGTRRS